MTQQYWTHNLDMNIFHVSDFHFDWIMKPLISLPIFLAYVFLWAGVLYSQKRISAGKPISVLKNLTVIETIKNILSFFGIAFLAIFILNKKQVDWGLRWYSTMYLVAYIYAYLMFKRWIRIGYTMLTSEMLENLVMYTIIGMLIGARLAYVFIYNLDQYIQNPADIIKIWEGGLSFHGGLVGCIVAFTIFCKKYSFPILHLLDRVALVTAFGVGVGRIGNFMNGELYGRVIQSHVPWAVIFPSGGPQPRHPSQIYQSLGEGWLVLIILAFLSRRKNKEGTVFSVSIILYGFNRYFIEFFREADEQLSYYFNNTTTMGQILCIITVLAGVVMLYLTRNNIQEGTETWLKRHQEFLNKHSPPVTS